MPRDFTPAERDCVLEKSRSMDSVHSAEAVGEGVALTYNQMSSTTHVYTTLTEQYGWYISLYEPRDDGDMAILMPITRVP